MLLKDKAVVVTGAGGGIGRDFALAMAAAGASVVVNDIGASVHGEGKDAGPAQKVVDEIRKAGGKAVASTDSVADWAAAQRIVECCLDSFKRIDAVVNNAGILRDRFFFNMSVEEWRAVIDVHLNGSFYGPDRQPRPGELLRGEARHRGALQVDRARHGALPRALELHRALRLEPHDRLDPDRDRGPEGARREAEDHGHGQDRAARGLPAFGFL
jgi:hypothetical protein